MLKWVIKSARALLILEMKYYLCVQTSRGVFAKTREISYRVVTREALLQMQAIVDIFLLQWNVSYL